MSDINYKINTLEKQISELPIGYISKKIIKGKERYYQQWAENGKTKSKYISNDNVENYKDKIALRKKLEAELKEIKSSSEYIEQPQIENETFTTNILYGENLKLFAQTASSYKKRNCYNQLEKYINSNTPEKICLIYGLRRTGKTTLIRQSLLSLSSEDFEKSVYIKATVNNTMAELNKDLKKLLKLGIKYVYIDEITLIKDFIDTTAILSDIYSSLGMKIILSGTDSLGFWLTQYGELYDRNVMIHTTYISFAEHSQLLGINDIDEYIQYGGTLKAGTWDFDTNKIDLEEASFRDDETTRIYIDTSISSNIQHSLKYYQGGNHFRHLYELYEKNELTGAINRIIENMSHKFLARILTENFKSHDLHLAARNLRKDRDESHRIELLDNINESTVTTQLMEILEIKNQEDQKINITENHVREIKEYLKALDLIDEIEIRTIGTTEKVADYEIFIQPGMRYCQAKALVHTIMKDPKFNNLDIHTRNYITEKILAEVQGRMLEDIVLINMKQQSSPAKEVFKLQFAAGEYDMVIFDKTTTTCHLYEIKHSTQATPNQVKHLINKEKLQATEQQYGKIEGRTVLYKGEDFIDENGIEYRNVEKFLK